MNLWSRALNVFELWWRWKWSRYLMMCVVQRFGKPLKLVQSTQPSSIHLTLKVSGWQKVENNIKFSLYPSSDKRYFFYIFKGRIRNFPFIIIVGVELIVLSSIIKYYEKKRRVLNGRTISGPWKRCIGLCSTRKSTPPSGLQVASFGVWHLYNER